MRSNLTAGMALLIAALTLGHGGAATETCQVLSLRDTRNASPIAGLGMRGQWYVADWSAVELAAQGGVNAEVSCIAVSLLRRRATGEITTIPDLSCPASGMLIDMQPVADRDPIVRECVGSSAVLARHIGGSRHE